MAKLQQNGDTSNGHLENGSVLVKHAVQSNKSVFSKATTNLCWALENVMDYLSGFTQEGKHSPYLAGNFAPVIDERFDSQLDVVEGELPTSVNGAFLRIGPNPAFTPVGGYHWFDGDGMVHCVRIRDGRASYCNRFVDTNRLRCERQAGYPAYPKLGDMKGKWGLAHLLLRMVKEKLGVMQNNQYGGGTANTAIAYHAEKLLALHEGDLPYVLRVLCEGAVETMGRMGFDGTVHHAFTAHPKVDPVTGELFFFGYAVDRAPHCWYGMLDREGALVHDYGVPLQQGVMMHDFAITEDFAIFMDCPLVFDPKRMVKEGTMPFLFDKSRPLRFGVLPRYAKDASAIKWFEGEPMMIFHTVNAWQEGSTVKLYACAFKEFDLDGFTAKSDEDAMPHITEFCMDMETGEMGVRRVAAVAGDFPVVPASLLGRKTRYAYMGALRNGSQGTPEFYGVVKVDLMAPHPSQAVVGMIEYGGRKFGGEAYFAPREGAATEDDGHLLTFVTDEDTDTTELAVLDAKTMAQRPVARVRMARRVPYGFHCLWISEQQLQAQAASQQAARAVGGRQASAKGGLGTSLTGALHAE